MPEKCAEDELRTPRQRCLEMHQECSGFRKLRAPEPYRFQTRAGLIDFRAAMLPFTTAAGRQVFTAVHKQGRANHREAENGYQQNCRETPHDLCYVVRDGSCKPPLSRLIFRETNSATSSACS